MEAKGIKVAVLSETKLKHCGSYNLNDHIIYSSVPLQVRALSGVAIIMSRRWKDKIHSYEWVFDMIMKVRCRVKRGYVTFVSVYAPGEGCKEEMEEFY